jgi:hypothetical protein
VYTLNFGVPWLAPRWSGVASPGAAVPLLTGDGDLLMAMGSLATTAAAPAPNLAIAARDMTEVRALCLRLRTEPLLAVVRISPAELPRHLPPRDGAHLTERFRRTLGVAET